MATQEGSICLGSCILTVPCAICLVCEACLLSFHHIALCVTLLVSPLCRSAAGTLFPSHRFVCDTISVTAVSERCRYALSITLLCV
ncbi:hypothetical protein FKM82_022484 [Ascaphus truei]